MECMCTQTRPRFILSTERVLGKESKTVLTPKENSPLPGAQRWGVGGGRGGRGGWNPRRCTTQDGEPNTLPTGLFPLPMERS